MWRCKQEEEEVTQDPAAWREKRNLNTLSMVRVKSE